MLSCKETPPLSLVDFQILVGYVALLNTSHRSETVSFSLWTDNMKWFELENNKSRTNFYFFQIIHEWWLLTTVTFFFFFSITYSLKTRSGAKYSIWLLKFWYDLHPIANTIMLIQEYWIRVIWSLMCKQRNPFKTHKQTKWSSINQFILYCRFLVNVQISHYYFIAI